MLGEIQYLKYSVGLTVVNFSTCVFAIHSYSTYPYLQIVVRKFLRFNSALIKRYAEIFQQYTLLRKQRVEVFLTAKQWAEVFLNFSHYVV